MDLKTEKLKTEEQVKLSMACFGCRNCQVMYASTILFLVERPESLFERFFSFLKLGIPLQIDKCTTPYMCCVRVFSSDIADYLNCYSRPDE